MATLITKNSSTASAVPAAGDLVKGELAVNVTDKKVYTKDNSAAVVKLVGSLGNQEANAVAITGGTINGTTIGATTPSTGAFTTASASGGFTGNLTGNVTGNVSGTAANVTGVVAIANGGTGLSALGTGVQSALGQAVTGSGSFVLSTSPSLTTPNLGTPSAAVLTNATGLPLTTGVTGTLGVANGGTGQTTANAAFNALAPSQSTHAGKYLKTDGTNTSWDAIEINTADITGTLPVANGGTGTSTALTSGSVVFAGASGVYSQNNSNFYWDNAQGFLGIGTAVPTQRLHLNVSSGAIYTRITSNLDGLLVGLAGSIADISTNLNLSFGAGSGYAERGRFSTDGTFRVKGAGTAGSTDAFQVSGSAPANSFILNSSGNITLASPGTFTYSSGTANGVAYLNGSKVLTTGSALTYNGSVLGVADGSITAGNTAVVLTGKYSSGFPTTGAGYFQLQTNNVDGTTGGLTVLTNSAGTLRQSYRIHEDTTAAACYQSWNVGGSEQARLTSTGLGIGTSSPTEALTITNDNTYKLSLKRTADGSYAAFGASGNNLLIYNNGSERMRITSAGDVGIGTSSPGARLDVQTTAGRFQVQAYGAGSVLLNSNGVLAYNAANTRHEWQIANSTLMQLDSFGNLGLGVPPSAWRSGARAFQLGATGYASLNEQANGSTSLNFNCYESAANTWTYFVTGVAPTRYTQLSGQHAWFIAPSGTAGNTISFTQAMTLDASGQLAIGTTTASEMLTVAGGIGSRQNVNGAANILVINSNAGSSANARFRLASDVVVGNLQANSSTNSPQLALVCEGAYPLTFLTNNTERARITSGGVFLVGRTSPIITETFSSTGYGLFGGATVQGIIGDAGSGLVTVGAYSNHALELRTNNTERARITSGGMLLVGTTTAYGSGGLTIEPAGTSGVNLVWNKTVSGNVYATQFRYNGTIVGSIEINNTATSYVTSSDYRLKEHIAPMTGALAKVALLKPCTYKWKVDGSDGEGFIAHELAEVCPQAVTGEKDAVDKDGNPKYQGIDTSFLVATLTAAIQEQQAIITDLRARVAQLEAK